MISLTLISCSYCPSFKTQQITARAQHEPRLRKPYFAYAKTKTQISFAVTAQLISGFVFATWIEQSLYFLNPKFRAILCDCTALFVTGLVGNPEDRFLRTRLRFYLGNNFITSGPVFSPFSSSQYFTIVLMSFFNFLDIDQL